MLRVVLHACGCARASYCVLGDGDRHDCLRRINRFYQKKIGLLMQGRSALGQWLFTSSRKACTQISKVSHLLISNATPCFKSYLWNLCVACHHLENPQRHNYWCRLYTSLHVQLAVIAARNRCVDLESVHAGNFPDMR